MRDQAIIARLAAVGIEASASTPDELRAQVSRGRGARTEGPPRGGFRLLIGFGLHRSVFLFGFARNERDNIDSDELTTLQEIARSFLKASEEKIEQALEDGTLIEVQDGDESKKA